MVRQCVKWTGKDGVAAASLDSVCSGAHPSLSAISSWLHFTRRMIAMFAQRCINKLTCARCLGHQGCCPATLHTISLVPHSHLFFSNHLRYAFSTFSRFLTFFLITK